MTMTKVVGAFCGALLVFLLGSWLGEGLYHGGGGHGDGHDQAYVIDTGADESGEEEAQEPFVNLVAAADPSTGERNFRQCASCHNIEEPTNGVGPHLVDVYNREIASVDGFGYSGALPAGEQWNVEHLDPWLENPSGYASGTSMAYNGISDREDRAAMVAYLISTTEGAEMPQPVSASDESGGGSEGEGTVGEGSDGEGGSGDQAAAEGASGSQQMAATDQASGDQSSGGSESGGSESGDQSSGETDQAAGAAPSAGGIEQSTTAEAQEIEGAQQSGTEQGGVADSTDMAQDGGQGSGGGAGQEEVASEGSGSAGQGGDAASADSSGNAASGGDGSQQMAQASDGGDQGSGSDGSGDAASGGQGGGSASEGQDGAAAGGSEPQSEIAMAMQDADASAGEQVFRQCQACHVADSEQNRVGPHLMGVVGREIASVESFNRYSGALPDGEWTLENLDAWLESPRDFAQGTTMAYPGLSDIQDRADVIAYLQSVSQ